MTKSETQLTLQEEVMGVLRILQWMANRNEGLITADIESAHESLTALFQQALTSLKSEMEKKKIEVEIWVGGNQSYGHAEKFEAVRLSECQRVIDGYLK